MKVSSEEVCETLLNLGAIIDVKDNKHFTPLCLAAEAGNLAIVELLIRKGANVKHETIAGNSIMFLAGLKDHIHIVKLLYENEGVFYDQDVFDAVRFGNISLLKVMKDLGVDFNTKDFDGYTALHAASSWNANEELLNWLLDYGNVNIDSLSNGGATPLHEAARHGMLNIAKILVNRGAKINILSNDGGTPLSWAIDYGEEEVVQFLKYEIFKDKNTTESSEI